MTVGRSYRLPETPDRHDLAGELADRAVADVFTGARCLKDLVAADVDRDMMGAACAAVAEEDQVTWLLVCPGDRAAVVDLVAGEVRESDPPTGRLIRGVEDEPGAAEAASGGAGEGATAPYVGGADLLGRGSDESPGAGSASFHSRPFLTKTGQLCAGRTPPVVHTTSQGFWRRRRPQLSATDCLAWQLPAGHRAGGRRRFPHGSEDRFRPWPSRTASGELSATGTPRTEKTCQR